MFDKRSAQRDLETFRKKGPSRTTKILIAELLNLNVQNNSLLDIGGGVGAIHHELLNCGIKQAQAVDASNAYLAASREESISRGNTDRIKYFYGDFVDLAETLPESDIVTLDKVICCYDNMIALVGLSAAKARHLYGVIYPRDDWWVKALKPLLNLLPKLKQIPYRAFVHPAEEVDSLIRKQGFEVQFFRKFVFWQVVIYSK
ncbi:MAG: hypothetical protein HQ507_12345 [Candidatus Marinimicrobia bacterium]|nr:hypothetical protein [Candidatus Neomarinimicrobiota bacterium]